MAAFDIQGNTVSLLSPSSPANQNADLAIKAPVRVATTGSNITLSATQTIDSVALAVGDRILVKDQTDQTTNGIYSVQTGPWIRVLDANNNSQWAQGTNVLITQGTTNANTRWALAATNPIVLGTTAMVFSASTLAQAANVTINPAASTVGQALNINQTASGSTSSGQTTPFATNDWGLNEILVTSDNIVRPTSGAANKTAALLIQHNYGGSAMIGGRCSLDVLSIFNVGASSASNNDRNYQACLFAFYANQNDNGTHGTPLGAGFGGGSVGILDSGATNWVNITAWEFNVAVVGTATVSYKTLLQLASLPQDAVNGFTYDCMIGMSAQTGAVGWNTGILFGPMNGQQPLVASTSTIIATTGAYTVEHGIDFSSYGFNGYSLKMPGFNVAGTGNINFSGNCIAQSGTATPAGGTAGVGYLFSTTTNFGISFGSGAPTLSMAQGSLYLRSDGTINNRLYINTNGSTGWTAFNTAS